jgi:hypothetical protein
MPETPGHLGPHPQSVTHPWKRSSRCEHANCVEVAIADTQVLVRDSACPDGTHLTFSVEAWVTFVESLRSGDLGD